MSFNTVPLLISYFFKNLSLGLITTVMCIWGIILSIFDSDGRLIHHLCARPWAKSILFVCNVRLKIEGLDRIDPEAPRVYMVNHQSYFDIFSLLAAIPVDFKFILKKELMMIPLLGSAMKRTGYISIDRGDPRKALKSVNTAAEKMRKGASVIIFPEGTRSDDGSVGPFKKGGFHLAIKSGNPIVPVTLSNSLNIMPKGSLRINKGTVTVKIGEEIAVSDYSKKEIDRLVERVSDSIISGLTGDNRRNNANS